PPENHTRSLHDALPISSSRSAPTACVASAATRPSSARKATASSRVGTPRAAASSGDTEANSNGRAIAAVRASDATAMPAASLARSEEHTSELQSLAYLV